ncbi:hypothetical protein HT031_004359 [Scenedesmus sp. PABB004]|nr:hypothetical protein HT031_004359 [Scenedesmus sp. PABB004]
MRAARAAGGAPPPQPWWRSRCVAVAAAADGGQPRAAPPPVVLSPLPPPGAAPQSGPLGAWCEEEPSDGYVGPAPVRQQQQRQRRGPDNDAPRRGGGGRSAQPRRWKQQQGEPGQQGQQGEEPPRDMSRLLTKHIGQRDSAAGLLALMREPSRARSLAGVRLNTVHVATALRVLVDVRRQRPPHRRAGGAPPRGADAGADTSDSGARDDAGEDAAAAELLQLLDALAAAQLEAGAGPPPDVRSLSTLVYSWGKLAHRPAPALLERLLAAFLQQLERRTQQAHQQQPLRGPPEQPAGAAAAAAAAAPPPPDDQAHCRALSNLCWGLAKLGYGCSQPYQQRGDPLAQPPAAAALVAQQAAWAALARAVLLLAPAATPRDLSSLCYAFAAGGHRDVVLWSSLAPRVTAALGDFTPHDLSAALWAYATAGVPNQALFRGAAAAARQLLPGFTPQGLANVLWAFTACLDRVPPELSSAASAECLRRGSLAGFGPINLSLLAWVAAKAGSIDPLLAAALSRAAAASLPSFRAPELCRLLSALAHLGAADAALLDAAEPRLLAELERGALSVQVAAHGVWAFAAAGAPGAARLLPPLLELAAAHVRVLVRSGDATARLLSTLVLMRHRADGFMALLADTLTAGAAADAPPGGGAAAAAGGGAGAAAGGAAPAPAPAVNHLAQWDVKYLMQAAACLARLGHTEHHALLALLTAQFLARLPPGVAPAGARGGGGGGGGEDAGQVAGLRAALQHAILLLWAAAVLDARGAMPQLVRVAALLRGAGGVALSDKALAQLVQVHMWAQALGPAGAPLVAALPARLVAQVTHMWQHELVPAVQRSGLHSQVLLALTALRLRPVCEGITPDGMFSVDVMLRYKGADVALEVMGAEHYTSNTLPLGMPPAPPAPAAAAAAVQQQQQHVQAQRRHHLLLGPEQLRLRLLAARGYALATVSSFDWEARGGTAAGAAALLLGKLDDAVAAHAAAAAATQQEQQQQLGGAAAPARGRAADRRRTAARGPQPGRYGDDGGAAAEPPAVVSRLLAQAGRSRRAARGLLRRQQYAQDRAAAQAQGAGLLLAAAGAAGAAPSEHAGAAASAEPAPGAAALLGEGDGEFDMELDLDALAGE